MENVRIRGHDILVDVRAELEEFDWIRPKWTNDKLLAASPFRYDRTPSFFINLTELNGYPAGTWSDSGAYDDDWKSGGLVKLLSFTRNETIEETQDFLLLKYSELS